MHFLDMPVAQQQIDRGNRITRIGGGKGAAHVARGHPGARGERGMAGKRTLAKAVRARAK